MADARRIGVRLRRAPLVLLVQIQKDGETYKVLANPDVPAGDAVKEGDSLIVDTHAVTMKFTPQPDDELLLGFSGEMFETPVSSSLQRTDETGYADAARREQG